MQDIIQQDEHHRLLALNPTQSFIVQAPAGSGKTELLTQRVLTLLAHVNAPEEILAITFTKKAAAEMRARIIHSLKKAQTEPEPTTPHAKKTWILAKNVLQRDQDLNWSLVANPNRLRIQTIDSFNASLIKHLPILSHFGAPPEITNDAYPLYLEAVQEFLSHLEENVTWADAIATLLLHMDNDLNKVKNLLINMLQKRDQWLPYMMVDAEHPGLREELEKHLASVVSDALTNIENHFPLAHSEELLTLGRYAAFNLKLENQSVSNILHCLELTQLPKKHKQAWLGISELLLTKESTWRKQINKTTGFPAPSSAKNKDDKASFTEMKQRMTNLIEKFHGEEKLLQAFKALTNAPASEYQETQWKTLQALYSVLRIVVAQLKVVFQNHSKIDYIENAQAALMALGDEETPTDLALALDYQIKHLLIDEFQDTSNSQYRLIQKLITGWEPNDGRTLFVVGDPMQSIYRFREAEVGLFIRARTHGIGNVKLIPLTLSLNFRSTVTVVDWVNKHFQKILPTHEEIGTGAVSYCNSVTVKENTDDSSVILHSFTNDDVAQAKKIVELIQQIQASKSDEKIAILVRSRTHLEYIIPHLKNHSIPYRAIDIDPLDSRQIIQDMMALTRALLHTGDRIAWLAVLRAPWCGLSLSDLLILDDNKPLNTIWQQLEDANVLSKISEEGQKRLQRVLPVLKTKMGERRRFSLRLWIESAWLSLGGPACVEQASDLDDIAAYLNLLEELDIGCDIENLDSLDKCVSKLFAAPNNQPNINLQIMTIHNAKGLEFDTVILPHLERKSPNDEKQLLLWMEQPRANANNALILAPVHAIGNDNDSIYEYIRRQHNIKSDYESGRLLYVAVTRAKKHLHLFFTLNQDEGEEVKDLKPTSKSLLEKLWPAIKDSVAFNPLQNAELPNIEAVPQVLKRLKTDWINPVKEVGASNPSAPHQKAPGFYLGEDDPRYVGTLVHLILQQIQRFGIDWWVKQSPDAQQSYICVHLLRLGMLRNHIEVAAVTTRAAITNTLQDERGKWILHLHPESKSEYALTAVFDNTCELLVVDRTFIDEKGARWVIDYKTAFFDGKDLNTFLLAEKKLYQEKMEMYRQAFDYLDEKSIKLGLYFPLIPAWLEWELETTCA